MIHTMTMGLRVKKRHERTAYINMEQILYLWITNAHALNIESCFLNSHWPITTNVVNSNSAQMRCTWYTTLCYEVCQWLATGQWFSPNTLASSTNKTDCHNTTEILLKMVLNILTLTLNSHCLHFQI